MSETDKSFAENVIIAVVVDLCKSFLIFCSAFIYTLIKRALHRKDRQHEKKKDTIPDDELFE